MDILVLSLLLIFIWKASIKKGINDEYLSFDTTQAWKGFFALVVLCHHLSQRTLSGYFFRLFENVGFLSVAVFFFFSGYGLQKKYITDNNYKNGYLITRVPTVLFPYIIMTAIYWAMHALFGEIYSFGDIFAALLEGHPIVTFSWYVINIVVFYCAFYILMKISKNHYNIMITGACLFYVLWVFLCSKCGFGGWWYNSTHLLVVGMFWATHEQKINKFIKEHRYRASFAIIAVLVLLFLIIRFASQRNIETIASLFSTVAFTMIILLLSMKIRIGNRLLSFFGKISFEIYLSQGIFMVFFTKEVIHITSDLLWSLFVIFSTLITSVLLHKLFQIILSQYRKLISPKLFRKSC